MPHMFSWQRLVTNIQMENVHLAEDTFTDKGRGWKGCGTSAVVLPREQDGFNTHVLQNLAGVGLQALCDTKVFSS